MWNEENRHNTLTRVCFRVVFHYGFFIEQMFGGTE
jgi:hypothetical protein